MMIDRGYRPPQKAGLEDTRETKAINQRNARTEAADMADAAAGDASPDGGWAPCCCCLLLRWCGEWRRTPPGLLLLPLPLAGGGAVGRRLKNLLMLCCCILNAAHCRPAGM